jgi:hypothetical protein
MTSAVVGYWSGSLSYNGFTVPFGQIDENGTVWLLHGVDGWDGVDIGAGDITQNSADHGGTPSPQFYAPRPVTLRVTAMSPTQAIRDMSRARMHSVVPIGDGPDATTDLATFVYNEPIPKTAQLRRNGRMVEISLDLTSVSFSIPLAAPDPRKYSLQNYTTTIQAPTVTTGLAFPLTFPITWPDSPPSNQGAATNHGNFNSPFVANIYGPWTAPSLSSAEQNKTISYSSLVLGAGDVLTVDTARFLSYLNGAYRPADLGSSWFRLLPDGVSPKGVSGGVNSVRLGGSGSGFAQISYSDAWQ